MKLLKFIVLTIFISTISCKETNKEDKNLQETNSAKQLKPLKESTIKELTLLEPQESFKHENIEFSYSGATFSNTKKSYLEFDLNKLPLNDGLSINMVFNLTGEDGTKPQTLLTFVSGNPKTNNEFTFYIAGNRLTGILNDYQLFGNNYSSKEGMSSKYFDSPRLQLNKYYSLTIILKSTKVSFYVNGELYSEFDNIKLNDIEGEKFVLGAYKKSVKSEQSRFFSGTIRFLEIYNREMVISEISDYYIINEPQISEYNEKRDFKKMEETDN